MLLVPVADTTDEAIETAEELAESLFQNITSFYNVSSLTQVGVTEEGDAVVPKEVPSRLYFDEDSWISLFRLSMSYNATSEEGRYWAIFTEHVPTEFLRDGADTDLSERSYLHNTAENAFLTPAVEFSSVESEEGGDDNLSSSAWGRIIGACVVVWLCNFVGLSNIVYVLTVAPFLGSSSKGGAQESQSVSSSWQSAYFSSKQWHQYFNYFAAGALLSTAFSLILLESGHMIEEKSGGIAEGAAHGHLAAMVLTGFVTPYVFEILLDPVFGAAEPVQADSTNDNAVVVDDNAVAATSVVVVDEKQLSDVAEEGQLQVQNDTDINKGRVADQQQHASSGLTPAQRFRLLLAVLVGDFFHNFCDGIFIGAAFRSCGGAFGWTVALTTIFHELPQELADYFVLTRTLGFSVFTALLANGIMGLSVVFGGIAMAAESIDDYTVGMLLAFGAGQYIFVAGVELLGNSHHHHHAPAPTAAHTHEHAEEPARPTTPQSAAILRKQMAVTRLLCLGCFIVGAVAVGLVLLDHDHCEADAASGAGHSGHSH